MKQERPLLIVTSCTRNYGWVTRAFLEGNTRWADYIIIVDQMSTDATRPLIKEYNALRGDGIHRAEIITIDDPDMTYKENIRAKMAFMKGRELAAGRDAIYFALDIDEVMPANWMRTADGQNILNSKPGDMFQLEWANIMPDGKNFTQPGWQYKVFHDNGMDWQKSTLQIHSPILPYSSWDIEPTKINDFPLLHFGEFHTSWNTYKQIYYQFVDVQQERSKNPISIYRKYHQKASKELPKKELRQEWLYQDVDIIGMVDIISKPIFVPYIKEIITKEGVSKFQSIDVWTKEFCKMIEVADPRSLGYKLLHTYLRATRPIANAFLVRGIDKFLKKMI